MSNQVDLFFCFLQKIVTRSQCDIAKNYTTESDISNGRCSIIIKDLQPEHNYTLAVRSTCPITSSFSSSSHYVFYDRARLFSFQTSTGSPDLLSLRLSFDAQKKILSWNFATINKNVKSSTPYLGPDFFYELLTRSVFRQSYPEGELNLCFIQIQ